VNFSSFVNTWSCFWVTRKKSLLDDVATKNFCITALGAFTETGQFFGYVQAKNLPGAAFSETSGRLYENPSHYDNWWLKVT
jgi:hypothetical protein